MSHRSKQALAVAARPAARLYVGARFPAPLVDRLDAAAAAEERNRSAMVRRLVAEALAAREARNSTAAPAA